MRGVRPALVRELMLDAVSPGVVGWLGGAWFRDAGFRVLDHAELDRVRAVVIDAVAVEDVGVGEGAVAGRAVRAVDAVPAASATGAADRRPARLVLRHLGRLRPAEPGGGRVRVDGQSVVPTWAVTLRSQAGRAGSPGRLPGTGGTRAGFVDQGGREPEPAARRARTVGCSETQVNRGRIRILTRSNKYEPYRGGRCQQRSQENDKEYRSAAEPPAHRVARRCH